MMALGIWIWCAAVWNQHTYATWFQFLVLFVTVVSSLFFTAVGK